MGRALLLIILILQMALQTSGQLPEAEKRKALLKSIEYSNPDLLAPPAYKGSGYPVKETDSSIFEGFRNPPSGYGEVPFWWWSGDKLDKDRLLWQIEELSKKGITGMQVNYIHKDSPGWPTYPADPEIFSEEWWRLWRYAAAEASKRNMAIGMSGYTIDWPKSQNLFNKIIYSIREIQGQELKVDTVINLEKGKTLSFTVPENLLQAWAYQVKDNKIIPGGLSLKSDINNRALTWRSDSLDYEIWIYAVDRKPGTINPMHPLSCKTVINKFFQPFEDNAGMGNTSGLNYFFQDELKFGVGDIIWTDDFDKEFISQKGYDIFTILPALFKDIGKVTPKARLDFMDVKVRLTEERYFKPIFEWHWSRGKIYGCDPEGRGKEPGMYGDNFRAIRWYTAPGHDTPSGHADLIKGKISSSIAALYRRPRVWLEGYHSLGWGATPQQIMSATNENFLYGCNLLNLHGLYYTTHGSFWEWAPPCYHFRMPYWDHMPVFLNYFERLSWLMSHGTLETDIAILYPVSTAQARMGEKSANSFAFDGGSDLFNNGYDFMFIDDQSVIRADIKERHLNVTDQSFKVLIIPSMQAIRWTTITRALEFFNNGGIVIACGSIPEASDNAGSSDPELDRIVKQLFGGTSEEIKNGFNPSVQKNNSGGLGIYVKDIPSLTGLISSLLPKDLSSGDRIRYSHRKIGSRDVYMVMGAKRGSFCTFRSVGVADLWDPWTGNAIPLYCEKTNDGSRVFMPLDSTEAQIIVFTPESVMGKRFPEPSITSGMYGRIHHKIQLDGDWEFELKPTMDNRWGDFRLPVVEKMIGAEARIFNYTDESKNTSGFKRPGFDFSLWPGVTYGFGQKFWKLGPLPDDSDRRELDEQLGSLKKIDPSKPVIVNGKSYFWQSYSFSWRYGVEGDPGHQGFHGLKEEITDEFICLGKPGQGLNETIYGREKEGSLYYMWTSAFSDNGEEVVIDKGGLIPAAVLLNGKVVQSNSDSIKLKIGSNPLLLKYTKAGRGHFVLLKKIFNLPSSRTPLAMKWWDISGRISYDVHPDRKSPAGWYRFTAPPGLKSMLIRSNGRLKVWINGENQQVKASDTLKSAAEVDLNGSMTGKCEVVIKVAQSRGNYGGEAFPEPVLVKCTKGVIQTGDWATGSILENYSGGAWYRKTFRLTDVESGSKVILDLGKVIATAEIHVNGSPVGILVTSPWRTNISGCIKTGENAIEVLVYNTLANHYLTIPTKYRGSDLQSGLIGPVIIEIQDKQ